MKTRFNPKALPLGNDLFGDDALPSQDESHTREVRDDGSSAPSPNQAETPPADRRTRNQRGNPQPRASEDLKPGTAKVRLNVARLPDDELVMTCTAHLRATKDNPLFADLKPDNKAYSALTDEFRNSVSEIARIKSLLDVAYRERDRKRQALELGTGMRIASVQIITKGNSAGISSAGFATQKKPSPIGILAPPQNLVVTLNDTSGWMEVTWDAVKKNRGYMLQYAEGKIGDESPAWTIVIASKPRYIFREMTPGTSYLFRVATIGGKGGQSAWSPIAARTAH